MQPFTSPAGVWELGVWASGGPWGQGLSTTGLRGVGPSSQNPCSHFTVDPSAPSDCGLGPRMWSEPNSQKPLGDPSPEREPEPTPDVVAMITVSLCGGLADGRDISLGMSDPGLSPSKNWH